MNGKLNQKGYFEAYEQAVEDPLQKMHDDKEARKREEIEAREKERRMRIRQEKEEKQKRQRRYDL